MSILNTPINVPIRALDNPLIVGALRSVGYPRSGNFYTIVGPGDGEAHYKARERLGGTAVLTPDTLLNLPISDLDVLRRLQGGLPSSQWISSHLPLIEIVKLLFDAYHIRHLRIFDRYFFSHPPRPDNYAFFKELLEFLKRSAAKPEGGWVVDILVRNQPEGRKSTAAETLEHLETVKRNFGNLVDHHFRGVFPKQCRMRLLGDGNAKFHSRGLLCQILGIGLSDSFNSVENKEIYLLPETMHARHWALFDASQVLTTRGQG